LKDEKFNKHMKEINDLIDKKIETKTNGADIKI
jgi:hypothetical protein